MFRIMFRLFFWVLIGQWAYSEVKLVFPSATPIIDSALSRLQIPTHDRWSAQSVDSFIAGARDLGKSALTPARGAVQQSSGTASQVQDFVKVQVREMRKASRSLADNDGFSRF